MIKTREQCVLEKYIEANGVRESKKKIHEKILDNSIRMKYDLVKRTELFYELESKALYAWKLREQEQLCKELKKKSLEIRNIHELQKKINKITNSQELKLVRRQRSMGPKSNPLPYMRKIRESLSKSVDIVEKPVKKKVVEPKLSSVIPFQELALKLNPKFNYKF